MDGILPGIGDYHSNDPLPHLNRDLIARHLKVFQLFRNTGLSNAILPNTAWSPTAVALVDLRHT